MNYLLDNHRVQKMGYYVPNLGTPLLSIKQHIKYKGCYFHAEDNLCILAFPGFVIQATIADEITLPITPSTDSSQSYAHTLNVVNPTLVKLAYKHIVPTEITQVFTTKLIPSAVILTHTNLGSAGFAIKNTHNLELPPPSTQ